MKVALVCPTHLTTFISKEIPQSQPNTQSTLFLDTNPKDIFKTLYTSYRLERVLACPVQVTVKEVEKLTFEIPQGMKEILTNKTYRVTVDRRDESEVSSVDLEKHIGRVLCSQGIDNVHLTRPELVVYGVYENGDVIFGVDLAGKDLSKREYKVFNSNQSINPIVASSFLDYIPREDDTTLVNPFARDGVSINRDQKKSSLLQSRI